MGLLEEKKISMQQRFKQIREYYGLSQAQFAQKINMSPGFISNVETGRTKISDRTANQVCNVFPINRVWLLSGEGQMFTGETRPVDKDGIAERVRVVRKKAGLTQEEFARRISYSKLQIHSVEKRKVAPSNHFLEKIVVEFEVSREWMFTGMGEMEQETEELKWLNAHPTALIEWLKRHPDVVRELKKQIDEG